MTTELKNRLLWAFIPAAAVLLVIFLGTEFVFLTSASAALLGWREYARMMDLKEGSAFYYPACILLLIMFMHTFFIGPKTFFWFWAAWLLSFAIVAFESYTHRAQKDATFDPVQAWRNMCRFVMGIIYIFMIYGFIGPISSKEHGSLLLIFSLLSVFMTDSGAYFVGRKKGKTKLWPALSPQKSLEGALGGWAISFLAALIMWAICYKCAPGALPIGPTLLVALVAPPLSQAGDFLESLMKRAGGRKDSGTLLPGHGGLLDRTDGLVFVMPLVYFVF